LLKSLKLRSPFWTLETLSKGLAHLTQSDQLQSLKFEASDESVLTLEKKPWKRIEGLCNFIKNQKDSLRKLHAYIPLALEENTILHITEAVSKLNELKKFEFRLNECDTCGPVILKSYFQDTLQKEIPESLRNEFQPIKSWNPSITKPLMKLQNLNEFIFKFQIPSQSYLKQNQKNQPNWFLDVMRALQGLKKLNKISITSRSGKELQSLEKKICSLVLGLREIREIRMVITGDIYLYDNVNFTCLNQTLREVNDRQSTRSAFMF